MTDEETPTPGRKKRGPPKYNLADPEVRAEMHAKRLQKLTARRLERDKEVLERVSNAISAEPSAVEGFDPDLYITAAEREEISRLARETIMKEKIALRRKQLLDEEIARQRKALGLMPEQEKRTKWMNEKVAITLNLPRQGPRDHPTLIIDGIVYQNGHTYQVSRAQWFTMREQMARVWEHEALLHGLSRNYFDGSQGVMTVMGGYAGGSVGERP